MRGPCKLVVQQRRSAAVDAQLGVAQMLRGAGKTKIQSECVSTPIFACSMMLRPDVAEGPRGYDKSCRLVVHEDKPHAG